MPAPRHRRISAHSPWDTPGRSDLHLEVPAWTRDALCAEVGVDLFFADGVGDQTSRLAKQVCAKCPVKTECLEWALSFDAWDDKDGVFGGTVPTERRALRREREQTEVAA